MGEGRVDYAVLISLMMREEAEIASGALRADGIDAFIGNSNHANSEWLLAPAFNGLQVLVPRQKLAEAKNLLRERIRENAAQDDADNERARRRDHWKMWLSLGVLFAPWLVYSGLVQRGEPSAWLVGVSLP
jgi:hypothetical protein